MSSCTGNANFATPNPKLADITAACDSTETAYNNALGGGVEETAILHANEFVLDTLIAAFAAYVDNIAQGSETIILSSGFEASKTPEPAGIPGQVTGLEAEMTKKKGEVKLRFDKLKAARAYIIAMGESPDEASFMQSAIVTSTRYLKTGLASLKVYWFRVCAVGTGGVTGPWSDPAESIAL